MSTAFSTALSGLTANATAIDIVSGNLANLNTTGYKDMNVSFDDLVNENLAGFSTSATISGSTVAQSSQDFTQGTLQTNRWCLRRRHSGRRLLRRQLPFRRPAFHAPGKFPRGCLRQPCHG